VEGHQLASPSRVSALGDSREHPSTRGSYARTWRPCPHMREQPIQRWPSGDWIESPPPTAYNVEPSGNIPPPCLQKTRRGKGNMMALTPQMTWAWVPTTHTSGHRTRLVYNPPPCSCGPWSGEGDAMPREPESFLRPEDPVASCSPVVGKGRLGPTTLLRVASVETVEAPARMPAQGGPSMPSCGREGINGSGVSCRPVANHINASFVYYSSCRKKK
jgi:hypothetical protein